VIQFLCGGNEQDMAYVELRSDQRGLHGSSGRCPNMCFLRGTYVAIFATNLDLSVCFCIAAIVQGHLRRPLSMLNLEVADDAGDILHNKKAVWS